MLVYGDRSDWTDPRLRLEQLRRELAAVGAMVPGIARHACLVEALIEGGRLLQGIADEDFARHGADRRTRAADGISDLVQALAQAVQRSWETSFEDLPPLPPVPEPPDLPDRVEMRVPEGYAFYALFPEAYIEAARRLKLTGPPRVIGLRSIGTSLAAAAAAALGAPRPVTLRPTGEPCARRIEIAPDLAAELLAEPQAHYVVADEGPGRSGSSFGAVADWLEARGVPLERIAFLPSHGGAPGPEASPRHEARWARAQRSVADLGPRLDTLLTEWVRPLLGMLDAPIVDLSAGAWRRFAFADESAWPAVIPALERRKFLASAGGETWLLKFAGLGREGRRKLDCARALHAAGLVPEPLGIVHGFLVERWHAEARQPPQRVPTEAVAHYLGARSRLLPRPDDSGAGLETLLEMSRRNAALALGGWAAAAFDRWAPRLGALSPRMRRVAVDSRLDRHEWLQLAGGRLLKADAFDHHAGHDLIGCQDIAWDVAGAAIELDLDGAATASLVRLVGRAAGRPIDPGLCEFLTLAYLAFRLGQFELGRQSVADAAEAARLRARAEAYAGRLERALGGRREVRLAS